ncbi:TrkA C-terminal domain-containing protein [Streptomyces sp. NPDC002962]|uniref:TrkA C-terminal domain-containing protein n=1 Tax=Streptomyces sp. NPDC002962 TaxID=3364674 RepID=UPI0036B8955D
MTGVGYAPGGEVADAAPVRELLRVAALCCDARLVPSQDAQRWRVLGDTTEGALLVVSRSPSPRPLSAGCVAFSTRSWGHERDRRRSGAARHPDRLAVPAATPLISLIEEATGATDTVALLRLSKAGVDVIETAITPRSRSAGRTLGDVELPEGTVVATIVRDGQPTVPDPSLRLRPGDEILLVSHTATEQEIHAAFQ